MTESTTKPAAAVQPEAAATGRLEAAHDRYRSQRSFGALDGLRCICIVAVVWHHARPLTDLPTLATRGFLGVDLFFVISGFLIVTLLLRERDQTGGISLQKFYIRRTLRIFPVYYAIVLALGGYYAFVANGSEVGDAFLRDFWIYLTYTGNFFFLGWGVVWSLAAEEQFYLVWPQVERRLSGWFVPIMVVALAVNQLFNFPATRDVIAAALNAPRLGELSMVQATFTPILLGVCVAHLLHDRASFVRLGPLVCGRLAPLFWLLALGVVVAIPNDEIAGIHRLGIHVLMAGLVASCVAQERHVVMPLLQLAPVARIGVISYGIYLYHIHSIVVAEKLLQRFGVHFDLAPFLLGGFIAIVVSELSFRLFEMPFLKLKARFATVPKGHV